MTTTVDRKEVEAAKEIVRTIRDAIKELGRVPSGTLYATVCGHLSLTSYQYVLSIIQAAGLIKIENHEIIWIGGQK